MTRSLFAALPASLALLAACAAGEAEEAATTAQDGEIPASAEIIMVAGGCFWCVESDFEAVDGVYEVVSGYAGGTTENPTYKNHVADGHREVAQIYYDPAQHDYAGLVRQFLRSVDVTDEGGQFCDRGHSYTTAVYYGSAEEEALARAALADAEAEIGQTVVTAVEPVSAFTAAEDYHQDYYQKNPIRYKYYRNACGRDRRIEALWGEAFH